MHKTTSHAYHRLEESLKKMCLLQSCPDAIDEVFDSKLYIIGGVGIAIGIVIVSV